MTANALDRVIARPAAPTPSTIGQATAVEQSRAVAEVQAAVVVAQNIPRNMVRAEAEMEDACRRIALANRAFYSVPNRGTGPSVHLARELARIWGNIQYGVHELRRDDSAGVSEVQAFAWDVQTNTRSTRTFVAPHARMKKVKGVQTREPLTDLGDIYLSNQNVGARAVRECIFTVLPTWFTEKAQDICRATLERGEGEPLADRITKMVAAFRTIGVAVDQLEQKTGRARAAWTAGDVAQLTISYTSITRDGLSKDEEFPSQRVTAEEILTPRSAPTQPPDTAPQAPAAADDVPPPDVDGMPDSQMRKMFALFREAAQFEASLADKDGQLDYLAEVIGRRVGSRKEIRAAEGEDIIASLGRYIAQQDPQGGESS
jgi:hypothetical protein